MILLASTALTALGLAVTAAPGTAGVRATAKGAALCGTLPAPAAKITHVVWVVLENRSYSEVMGAPYLSSLAAGCGVATNYHNLSHPSLPNYLAMTSGRPLAQLPTNDCPALCPVSGPSIFTQTPSWRVYAESMPGTCALRDARPYVVHHTAAPYFSAVTNCPLRDLPLTALDVAALPSFSLIVPNVNHDMHEVSSSVAVGDSWLRANLGPILESAAYRSGSTAVFVTWDEGGFPRRTDNCATNTNDSGCHVALLVLSPYTVPGTRWAGLANHYSLLRATEQLLHVPALGLAATAPSLTAAFGL